MTSTISEKICYSISLPNSEETSISPELTTSSDLALQYNQTEDNSTSNMNDSIIDTESFEDGTNITLTTNTTNTSNETEPAMVDQNLGQQVVAAALSTTLKNPIPGCRVLTKKGNSKGAMCVFPFTYKGTQRYGCITEDNKGVLWCGTTNSYDLDKLWGNCAGWSTRSHTAGS